MTRAETQESGELTTALWQRVARPWSYGGAEEPFLYDEVVRGEDGPDGEQVFSSYEILQRPNPNFGIEEPKDVRPTRLSDSFVELMDKETDGNVEIFVKLRDFPDWNIPPGVPLGWFTEEQVAVVQQERAVARQARESLFDTYIASVEAFITGHGGRITSKRWETGWLGIEIPVEAANLIVQRHDLVSVYAESELNQSVDQCNTSCNLRQEAEWKLGSGVNGPGGRDADKINAISFLNAGYDGMTGAENGRFLAAVVESHAFEDEALAFRTTSSTTSRIKQRYTCSASSCSTVSNYGDETAFNGGGHGTMVANVLLGDFEDNQASGLGYGDDCWDGVSHCSDWEKAVSGMAPEAQLNYYVAQFDARKEEAYLEAANDNKIDVLNASHAASDCDVASSFPKEDAAEIVYDEGILFVAAAGNFTSSGCNLGTPGDTPKVFTVNPYDVAPAACAGDFMDCDLDNELGTGGMAAPLSWGNVSDGQVP